MAGSRIRIVVSLLKAGDVKLLARMFRKRVLSVERSICLRRDLSIPFVPPQPRIPVRVRPMNKQDADILFATDTGKMSGISIMERAVPSLLFEKKVHWPYVAVTADDSPVYVQWLIPASENKRLQGLFSGGFPLLRDNEMLLEGALTLERYRGQGIMPAAMHVIAEKGRELHADCITTFVKENNTASLNGCRRCGFNPAGVRMDKWFFFKRTVVFDIQGQTTHEKISHA